jgi:hypothetical protein
MNSFLWRNLPNTAADRLKTDISNTNQPGLVLKGETVCDSVVFCVSYLAESGIYKMLV